ncbi:MAG: ABC transporter ATP-binding protein [Firmicutes bacterium]|nr:ABC transporter ATP-binding protein [Bacillota bacterium]
MSILVNKLVAGYDSKTVLKGIDLEIQKGRIYALLGRNGCGKTTLLRCINAIIRPIEGNIQIDGKDLAKLSRRHIARLVSVVPQSTVITFDYSSQEIVLMGEAARIPLWGAPGAAERRRAEKVFDQIGIKYLMKRPFNMLSSGERQMVLLARALFQNSPYMLLDEPNSHLDFSNQHRIMDLVRQLSRELNITVLVTLHDPNLALYYCDEVFLLHGGKILAEGCTDHVLQDSFLSHVYGENIRTDYTCNHGLPIVVPKNVAQPMAI